MDSIYIIFILSIALIVYNIHRKRKLDKNDEKYKVKKNASNFFINTGMTYIFLGISLWLENYVLLIISASVLFVLIAYHLYVMKKLND